MPSVQPQVTQLGDELRTRSAGTSNVWIHLGQGRWWTACDITWQWMDSREHLQETMEFYHFYQPKTGWSCKMSLKFWDSKQEIAKQRRCYKEQMAFLKPKVGINQCVLGTSTVRTVPRHIPNMPVTCWHERKSQHAHRNHPQLCQGKKRICHFAQAL